MKPVHRPGHDRTPRYDVLFVGEQTSLVMRLVAEVTRRGLRAALLNGPRLAERLRRECNLEVDHFVCPEVRLPGRYRTRVVRLLEKPMQRARLRAVLQRIRPAVIHFNYIRAEQALFGDLGSACPPTVASVWGTDLNRDAAGDSRQRAGIAGVLQRAGVITADSPHLLETARGLAPGKPESALRLVLWGIDADLFDCDEARRDAVVWHRRLEIPDGAAVVLAPRRINPRYHPERVLQAYARCRVPHSVLVFKLFGDHPATECRQQDKLLDLARELNVASRLRFAPPGPYRDLPGLYNLADAACFLLSHDGTPTTAFELMACGVPLVASDIPGYRGMLADGQHAGLVPPEDPAAAAARLHAILTRPEDFEAQRTFARQWVQHHATMELTVCRYLDAYRQAGAAVTRTP